MEPIQFERSGNREAETTGQNGAKKPFVGFYSQLGHRNILR